MSQNFEVVTRPFDSVLGGVIDFIPDFLGALLLLILGWIIGAVLGKAVAELFRRIKVIDNVLRSLGAEQILSKGGFSLDIGAFFGTLVKWFFIIIGLIAAVDVLGLSQVNVFLNRIVTDFLPDVIVAALILIVGAMLAHALHKVVTGGAKAADVPSSHFMGGIAKWSVWIFAILAALKQIGIAGDFASTLFQGIVAALAIALGLAFGLGGKDAASRYLDHLHSDIKEH